MTIIHLETDQDGVLRQRIEIGQHHVYADASLASGGTDSAPDPHGLFDASLAACKAITLMMYAKQRGMDLQRVSLHVARDASQERAGTYQLHVTLNLIGTLTDEERQKLLIIADKCPVHKLMTQTDIIVNTQLATADA
ncbi:MAG: OsmC family protein [Pseudomonadota bacterium]|nr:OsmC family protein [Pseudomonadota bacterium]